jgi:hypothetical protein
MGIAPESVEVKKQKKARSYDLAFLLNPEKVTSQTRIILR